MSCSFHWHFVCIDGWLEDRTGQAINRRSGAPASAHSSHGTPSDEAPADRARGFCYNFGRGIGALFPYLVGALSTTTTLANAIAIFAVAAYGVFFLAAFALPETRGKVLHADT